MTYYIWYDGMIRIGCMDHYQNLFTDGISTLARTAVPCPQQQCEGCTDMYHALVDEPRYQNPVELFTPEDYAHGQAGTNRSAPRTTRASPAGQQAVAEGQKHRLLATRGSEKSTSY